MKKFMLLCVLLTVSIGRGHANFDVPTNDVEYYFTRGCVAVCGIITTSIAVGALYSAYKNHKNKKDCVEDTEKTQARLEKLEREIEAAEAGGTQREGLAQEWDASNDVLQKKIAALKKMKREFIGELLLGGFCGVAACALFYFLYTIRIPKSARKKIEDMYDKTKSFLRKSRLRSSWILFPEEKGSWDRIAQAQATKLAVEAVKEDQSSLPSRVRKSLEPIVTALEDLSANDTERHSLVNQGDKYDIDDIALMVLGIFADGKTEQEASSRKYALACHKADGAINRHSFVWDKL